MLKMVFGVRFFLNTLSVKNEEGWGEVHGQSKCLCSIVLVVSTAFMNSHIKDLPFTSMIKKRPM